MKRTCLHTISIEDQRKLSTDEQNSCEFHLVEQLIKEQILDPKENQSIKSFVRMKKIIFTIIVLSFMFSACNDSFLEKYPLTSLTEENAFESYDNFKAFTYPLYEMFINKDILTSYYGGYASSSCYMGDYYAGYMTNKGTSAINPYAWK